MDDNEDSFDGLMRELRKLTEAGLVEIEERLSALETSRLPHSLPLVSVTADRTKSGCNSERVALLTRRIERLERAMYLENTQNRSTPWDWNCAHVPKCTVTSIEIVMDLKAQGL